jgi:hypothetical protein
MRAVWDVVQLATAKALVAAVFAFLSLLPASCLAGPEPSDGGTGSTGSSVQEESTPVTAPEGPETTEDGTPPEATLAEAPDSPAVLLRLEGDPETTFSGICDVGDKKRVLGGKIPKRYAFDPHGQRLSCRIEKRGSGGGNLKVILVAGDTTRSVQQTNAPGGVVNVSYYGN